MDWTIVSGELNRKLDPKHVKPARDFGPKGDYLEGWFVIQEANRIFGHDGWSYHVDEPRCVSERPKLIGKAQKEGFAVTYTCKVSVQVGAAVMREDFGAGHGYDVDCGLAHESAIKEAVTDALKRALRTFGNPFGLALYDKTRENVGVDEPPPLTASPTEIATAISMIEQMPDIATLGKYWLGLAENAKHVAKTPAVFDAKERRKATLAAMAQTADELAGAK